MGTIFYLRSGETAIARQAPAAGALPSGFLGAWTQTNNAYAGSSNAVFLDTSAGASQLSVTKSAGWSIIPLAHNATLGFAQYCSNPLAAQTISAGNWTFAWAASIAPSGFNDWQGACALYLVNGATGAIRTTIFSLTTIGSTRSTASSELTCYTGSASGASATATAGDYLVFECGADVFAPTHETYTPGSAAAIYDSGTTAPGSDDASISSCQSFIQAPVAITIQSGTNPTRWFPPWRKRRTPRRRRSKPGIATLLPPYIPPPQSNAWLRWRSRRPRRKRFRKDPIATLIPAYNPPAISQAWLRWQRKRWRRKRPWKAYFAPFIQPFIPPKKPQAWLKPPRKRWRKNPRWRNPIAALLSGSWFPTPRRKARLPRRRRLLRRLRYLLPALASFFPFVGRRLTKRRRPQWRRRQGPGLVPALGNPPPGTHTIIIIEELQAKAISAERYSAQALETEYGQAKALIDEKLPARALIAEAESGTALVGAKLQPDIALSLQELLRGTATAGEKYQATATQQEKMQATGLEQEVLATTALINEATTGTALMIEELEE